MKLTVLGNMGPYPGKNAGTSGYLLQTEQTNLLLDCGSGVVSELLAVLDLSDLSGIVLTHNHWDHVSDFMMLATAVQFGRMKGTVAKDFRIPVWMQKEPAAMSEFLTACPAADAFDFRFVSAGEKASLGGLDLAFAAARHPLPAVGVIAVCAEKKFYYTGDSNVLSTLAQDGKNADMILADCGLNAENWSENAPHLGALQCGELGRDAHAKRLLLGHLPPYVNAGSLLAEARMAFPAAELTQIGKTYII